MAFDVGALLGREAEILGHGFEAVAGEIAFEDVKRHNLKIGVDHVPAGDVEGGKFNGAFGKAHVGGKRPGHGAIAAQGKRDAVALAAGHEIGQVKGVNVVAFDDVRVAVLNELYEHPQHIGFAER